MNGGNVELEEGRLEVLEPIFEDKEENEVESMIGNDEHAEYDEKERVDKQRMQPEYNQNNSLISDQLVKDHGDIQFQVQCNQEMSGNSEVSNSQHDIDNKIIGNAKDEKVDNSLAQNSTNAGEEYFLDMFSTAWAQDNGTPQVNTSGVNLKAQRQREEVDLKSR